MVHPDTPAPSPLANGRVLRLREAATRLGDHPQDHGWRELYRLIAAALDSGAPALTHLAGAAAASRPESGDTHLVTMLGIALKATCPAVFPDLSAPHPLQDRTAHLERIVVEHGEDLLRLIAMRQNSFTGARRFLVPQVVLSAISARLPDGPGLRVCDLGTGLGVMPRQLNAPDVYARCAPGLRWPQGVPAYRPIRLQARYGVDRGPFPDLDWVASCYGASSYYRVILAELFDTVDHPQVRSAAVDYAALDMLDVEALTGFITANRVNAVNLCYALYELSESGREQVLAVLRETLAPPGIITVIEPERELSHQGCSVTVTETATGRHWRLLRVSDGHFRGTARPLEDFDAFCRSFPILFESPP